MISVLNRGVYPPTAMTQASPISFLPSFPSLFPFPLPAISLHSLPSPPRGSGGRAPVGGGSVGVTQEKWKLR